MRLILILCSLTLLVGCGGPSKKELHMQVEKERQRVQDLASIIRRQTAAKILSDRQGVRTYYLSAIAHFQWEVRVPQGEADALFEEGAIELVSITSTAPPKLGSRVFDANPKASKTSVTFAQFGRTLELEFVTPGRSTQPLLERIRVRSSEWSWSPHHAKVRGGELWVFQGLGPQNTRETLAFAKKEVKEEPILILAPILP